jgi:hypothetical protein
MLIVFKSIIESYLRLPQDKQWQSIKNTGIFYLKTIADSSILNVTNKNITPTLSYAFVPMKYDSYVMPPFGEGTDMMLGYFFVLSTLLPLITMIGKFMNDKTTRMRESMKIMGINDSTYFLSYFAFYAIIQFIVSFGCTAIIKTAMFPRSNYLLVATFFFLFGISIFPFAIIVW